MDRKKNQHKTKSVIKKEKTKSIKRRFRVKHGEIDVGGKSDICGRGKKHWGGEK